MKETDVLNLALEAILNRVNTADHITVEELIQFSDQVADIKKHMTFFIENPSFDIEI